MNPITKLLLRPEGEFRGVGEYQRPHIWGDGTRWTIYRSNSATSWGKWVVHPPYRSIDQNIPTYPYPLYFPDFEQARSAFEVLSEDFRT